MSERQKVVELEALARAVMPELVSLISHVQVEMSGPGSVLDMLDACEGVMQPRDPGRRLMERIRAMSLQISSDDPWSTGWTIAMFCQHAMGEWTAGQVQASPIGEA